MKLPFFLHRPRHPSVLLLVLAILGLVLAPNIPLAHATNPTYVKTVTGSQSSITFPGLAKGDFIGVDVFTTTVASLTGFSISDSQTNTYTTLWQNLNTFSGAWWAIAQQTGTDTITIACVGGGCSFSGGTADADQYTGVSTVLGSTYQTNCGSSCPSNSGQSAIQSNIVAGTGTIAWEPMMIVANNLQGSGLTLTAASATSDGVSPAPQSTNQCQGVGQREFCTYTTAPTVSFPIFRVNYAASGQGSGDSADHADVIIVGTSSSSGSSTSCFGNCGNPAVTLINANATHLINFNFTITLFYAFQSSVNGFVINETANIAKPYPVGIQVGLAIYTATCPVIVQPFSQQCPGTMTTNQVKIVSGKGFDSATSGTPIIPGEWIAIAVSAQFSGLDINETNSLCTNQCFDSGHLQYSNGFLPPVLSGVGRCAAAGTLCNMAGIDNTGLWAFASGTIVTTGPPSSQTFNCPGLLDCVLPNLVGSFCSTGNPGCIAVSALVWSGILALVSALAVGKYGTELAPNIKIPFGEIFLFFGVVWIAVMGGLSLTLAWVTLLMFLVVSIIFGKQVGHYL